MGGCKRRRPAPASLRRATNAPADSAAGGRKPPKFPRAKYGAEYRTKKQKQLLKKGRFGFLRNALFIAASNGLNCRPVYPGKNKSRFRGAFRLIRHILLYIRNYYIRRLHFRKISGEIPQKVGFFSKFANPKPLLRARVYAYCAKGAKKILAHASFPRRTIAPPKLRAAAKPLQIPPNFLRLGRKITFPRQVQKRIRRNPSTIPKLAAGQPQYPFPSPSFRRRLRMRSDCAV